MRDWQKTFDFSGFAAIFYGNRGIIAVAVWIGKFFLAFKKCLCYTIKAVPLDSVVFAIEKAVCRFQIT